MAPGISGSGEGSLTSFGTSSRPNSLSNGCNMHREEEEKKN